MIRESKDIRRYIFSEEDRLFLDANIWLLIYGPVPRSDKDRFLRNIYTNAFRNMLMNNSKIFVDDLILSEFINAFRQLEFKRMIPEFEWSQGFKRFRDSSEAVEMAREIASQSRKILKVSERCSSIFNFVNIDDLLNEFEKGHSDFNDQLYIELCKADGLILVTNDGDFKNRGVPVLTANPSMLK